jgi:protein tyrosine phosphatase (PTP) superfamily phosphohydrolase (DUF442 family)
MQVSRRSVLRTAALAGAGLALGAGLLKPVFADGEGKLKLFVQTDVWNTGPRSGPKEVAPIANFGVVDPGCLYRGAQPSTDGYKWLQKMGFRGIVNLRSEHDEGAERMKSFGMNYLHLKIRNEYAPSDEQAREFLAFVRNKDNWPIYVHCSAGMGRCGTMVGLVRHSVDGWDMSDAMSEGRKYRPLGMPLIGRQKKWLSRWQERVVAGSFRPDKEEPAVPTVVMGR